jgi:hypothetical protein
MPAGDDVTVPVPLPTFVTTSVTAPVASTFELPLLQHVPSMHSNPGGHSSSGPHASSPSRKLGEKHAPITNSTSQ